MKRAVLLLCVIGVVLLDLVSCGKGAPNSTKKTHVTGNPQRLAASQSVSGNNASPGVYLVNGVLNFNVPFDNPISEISAGANPTFIRLSPNLKNMLVANQLVGSPSVQIIDTTTEANTGSVPMPGLISGMTLGGNTALGYAAVPSAPVIGYPPGAIEMLNLAASTAITIGVPNAQNVVSNLAGTQLLVFSSDSDAISVISPLNAVGPVDQGCDLPNPSVCLVVPGFDRPVFAILSGNTAYVLNCGPECGGKQASVQTLNLSTFALGTPLPLDGATYAALSGTTLYVAGNNLTDDACTGETTAATHCGRLDVVDLNSMTVTHRVVITDGYHDVMSMGLGGALFVGSYNCTEIGNANNPVGEVRGCLTIVNTIDPNNLTVVVPPDSGDVTGLQGLVSYYEEFVAQGGNLRVYSTQTDQLIISNPYLTNGTVLINGLVYDVRAVDFF